MEEQSNSAESKEIRRDVSGACSARASGDMPPETGKRPKWTALLTRYAVITAGCILLGAGIALFLDPNRLAPGGISGVAIILNKFIPVSTGLLILLLNVPLLVIGGIKLGGRFLISTTYATIMLSLSTDLIGWIMELCGTARATDDLFLAALFGGVLCALGLGLVFRCQCTTGGLDIVVMLIHKRWRHLGVGKIFLIVDFLIAGISALVFRDLRVGLYSCFGIAVYSILMDFVVYGGSGAKMVYVVGEHPQAVKRRILTELEIGVTDLAGVGGYTGADKTVLLCAVKKHLYPRLRDIVREEDPAAFMIVGDAHEVYGLGFRSHHDEL